MTPTLLTLFALSPVALWPWTGAPAATPAPRPPQDCDALYYGDARPKDLPGALACYRVEENWSMVAIMQLNGEGTPIDVAGARATFDRMEPADGDTMALRPILEDREAHPNAKAKRIDFCAVVATTTPSLAYCAGRAASRVEAEDAKQLAQLRSGIEAGARPAFDAAVAAAEEFMAAERERVYQKWIDGTIRSQASISGELFARANFMRRIQLLAGAGGPPPGAARRSFAAADQQLNVDYRQDTGGNSPRDYKSASRRTQHAWIRYRDAMAKLAAARWPSRTDVADVTRALVTEDRIAELTPGEGDIR